MSNRTNFNVGPQHPALKEPETFRVIVEGERIVEAVPILGHTHRGIEKLAESRDTDKNLYLAERICGICSFAHQANYARAVEIIGNITLPRRANYLRSLVGELERLHSHLLWVGVLAHEIGFDTFYLLVWRDREIVMDLLESLTGNRVNYGMNKIGGVRSDLTPALVKEFQVKLPEIKTKLKKIKEIVINDKTVKSRTENVGVITNQIAKRTCVTGPTARASGIDWDIRRDEPYFAYDELSFKVQKATKGDVYSKIVVRINELFESIGIIEQILDQIPEGPIETRPERRYTGQAVSQIEAPRGENFHYLDFRNDKVPYRMKVRAPTYANMKSAMEVLIGHHIADIPVIVAANDPCFSCTDRTLIIDRDADRFNVLSKKKLREFSINSYKEEII